jgi:putative phage-type endonuclease
MMEQRTEEWFAARLGRVTASRIADVMMKPATAGFQNYKAQLVCERLTGVAAETFTSGAMQHGTDTEPQARAFYEMETGHDVEEVGFVPHPKLVMAGASPDGLVSTDGLVEIKCPQPAKHLKNLTGGGIDRNYMLQMQWQMICTKRDWCDFVSFSTAFPVDMQLHRVRVDLDAEMAEDITEAVTRFIAEIDTTISDLTQRFNLETAT